MPQADQVHVLPAEQRSASEHFKGLARKARKPLPGRRRINQAISRKIPSTTPRLPNTVAIDGRPVGFVNASWDLLVFDGEEATRDCRLCGVKESLCCFFYRRLPAVPRSLFLWTIFSSAATGGAIRTVPGDGSGSRSITQAGGGSASATMRIYHLSCWNTSVRGDFPAIERERSKVRFELSKASVHFLAFFIKAGRRVKPITRRAILQLNFFSSKSFLLSKIRQQCTTAACKQCFRSKHSYVVTVGILACRFRPDRNVWPPVIYPLNPFAGDQLGHAHAKIVV